MSNAVALHDSVTAAGLREESQKDNKPLARLVSILMLLFLPGTFISVRFPPHVPKNLGSVISYNASSACDSLAFLLVMEQLHSDGLSPLRFGSSSSRLSRQ